jgi:DNA-repair protein complementing XP-A cells
MQRQREEQQVASSSSVNSNNKRSLNTVVSADSTSPTRPEKLKRDSRLGKYYDYDLSKMANSKGGFLVEDDQEVDEEQRRKEMQRERERAKQNLEPRRLRSSYRHKAS